MKTILEICREAADLAAAKRPENLFNIASQQDSIFLSVAKSALDSLLRYGDWQELTKEGCLFTFAGQKQYAIADVAPDFYSLLPNTIYIKDTHEHIIGAITPQQWMKDKYFYSSSTDIKFKIQNGRFVFLREPPARVKIVFQYRSNNIVWDFKTYEEKNILTANTDVPIFDEYLVKLGILWRWLKRSGLDYSEEIGEYERELKKRYGAERATKNICLASTPENLGQGVIINEIKADTAN
ncbi:MAG: hypothetical protein IJ525_04360 [Alphaproteobacteria bacterium]|nr:hypothetical protein [Alphaproteobacteria bacterium]MBR3501588.1 hypothetical protein [Alphaproteobacteria bacterium]